MAQIKISALTTGTPKGTDLTPATDTTDTTQAASGTTKKYVRSAELNFYLEAQGLTTYTAVSLATTLAFTVTYANGALGVGATLTNAGPQAALTVDGVAVAVSDRILVKNQASSLQNGIYTVTNIGSGATNWVLTRATDYDQAAEIVQYGVVLVNAGTTNAGILFEEQSPGPFTMGTSAITFSAYSVAGSVTPQEVQSSAFNFATTAGAADAYTLTLNPPVLSYIDGLLVTITANADNTTATPTLNVNGLGAINIVLWSGNLLAGDINSGNTYLLVYSSSNNNFTLINPSVSTANTGLVQSNFYNYGLDSGAVNAYDVTLVPVPTAVATSGLQVFFTVANANTNTGASTLTVNGTTAPIYYTDGTPLLGGEIVQNTLAHVIYSSNFGGCFLLQNPIIASVNRPVAAIVVSQDTSLSSYNTVAAGIAAAAALLPTATSPETVWILPGTYTEGALLMAANVNLAAAASCFVGSSVNIISNLTHANDDDFSLTNICVTSPNASAAFATTSVSTPNVTLSNCQFAAGAGIGLQCAGTSNVNVTGCSFSTSASGRCFDVSNGVVSVVGSIMQQTDTASTIAVGLLVIVSSDLYDSFNMTSGNLQVFNTHFLSDLSPCITVGGAAAASVKSSTMATNAAGVNLVEGTGIFTYGAVVIEDGTGFQSTLTIDGNVCAVGQTALIGNLDITDNSISAVDTGGNITLIPDTTGNVDIFTPPAVESSSITVNGAAYNTAFRINDIGTVAPAQSIIHRHSTTLEPILLSVRSNSDTDAHIAVTNGMALSSAYTGGWTGTQYSLFGQIRISADGTGTISDTSAPGKLDLMVSPDASITPVSALSIANTGVVTLAQPLPVTSGGTGLSTVAINSLLFASAANVIGQVTPSNSGVLLSNVSDVPFWSGPINDGEFIIGQTGSVPTVGSITAGAGITVVNNPGGITISGSGGGIGWVDVAASPQAIAVETAYVANTAGLLTFSLPVTAAFGTVFSVVGNGAGGWIITQNAGQNIQIGAVSSTIGVGGSVASSNQFDSACFVCTVANTTWVNVGGVQGTLTIV